MPTLSLAEARAQLAATAAGPAGPPVPKPKPLRMSLAQAREALSAGVPPAPARQAPVTPEQYAALGELPGVKLVPRTALGPAAQPPARAHVHTRESQTQARVAQPPTATTRVRGLVETPEPLPTALERGSWAEAGKKLAQNTMPAFRQAIGGLFQQLGELKQYGPAGFWRWAAGIGSPTDEGVGEGLAGFGAEMYREASRELRENAPDLDPGSAEQYAYDVANAVVQMVPLIAVSVATKNPSLALLTTMGPQVYGQRYGESREMGRTPEQSAVDAGFYALAETIPERIPLGFLTKEGTKFLPRVLKSAGAEYLQEMFTQVLESGYDMGVLRPEMTWGEAWEEVKRAGLVGAGAGGVLAALTHPFVRRRGVKPGADGPAPDEAREAPEGPTAPSAQPAGPDYLREFEEIMGERRAPEEMPEMTAPPPPEAAAEVARIDREAARAEPPKSEAQAEAGTYRKGHITFAGMDVSIETPKGQQRRGFATPLPAHYGYIRGSKGRDGDQIDVLIGPDPASDRVFVIDQVDPETGGFDEHKAVLGAETREQAEALYRGSYDDRAEGRLGAMTELSVEQFRAWMEEDGARRKAISERVRMPVAAPLRGAQRALPAPARVEEPATPVARPEAPAVPQRLSLEEAKAQLEPQRKLYRGFGRTTEEGIYGPMSAGVPVAGPGRYFAFESKHAERYGPQIEETDLAAAGLRNPLTISSDEEWRTLTRAVGWDVPNLAGKPRAEVERLTAALQAEVRRRGHDGLLIDWDDTSPYDVDRRTGGGIKLLRNVFDIPQAVAFDRPVAPAAPPVVESILPVAPPVSQPPGRPEARPAAISPQPEIPGERAEPGAGVPRVEEPPPSVVGAEEREPRQLAAPALTLEPHSDQALIIRGQQEAKARERLPTAAELAPFLPPNWVIARKGTKRGVKEGQTPITRAQYEAAQRAALEARTQLPTEPTPVPAAEAAEIGRQLPHMEGRTVGQIKRGDIAIVADESTISYQKPPRSEKVTRYIPVRITGLDQEGTEVKQVQRLGGGTLKREMPGRVGRRGWDAIYTLPIHLIRDPAALEADLQGISIGSIEDIEPIIRRHAITDLPKLNLEGRSRTTGGGPPQRPLFDMSERLLPAPPSRLEGFKPKKHRIAVPGGGGYITVTERWPWTDWYRQNVYQSVRDLWSGGTAAMDERAYDEARQARDEPTPEQPGAAPPGGQIEFHAGIPFGKLWDWFLGPFFKRHYETFGRLPGGKRRYMQPRRLAQGRIDEMDKLAGDIFRQLNSFDEKTKDQIYQYLTDPHASTASIGNPEARPVARNVKKLIDLAGRELVWRGALAPAQYAKYKDQYLPRIYLKFLFETEGVMLGGGGRPIVSKEMMGRLKRRKDLPAWQRDILLGEIKDPAYLAARAFGEAARSVAIWDFLETVSQHPEWIYPQGLVNWRGRKVTARWLEAEAQRLMEMKPRYPNHMQPAVQRMIDDMMIEARQAIGDPPDPKLYRQVPDSKRYGYMRGLWVRREIHDDIVNSVAPTYADETFRYIAQQARKANSLWKGFKTAWSVPAQLRNAMSGYVQAHLFGGVPFVRMPDRLLETVYDMATDGPYWRAAKKHGVKSTSFAQAELLQLHNEFKLKLALKHYRSNPWRWWRELFARVNDRVGDVYSLNEQLWKTLVMMHHMKKGVPADDASDLAHESIFDYSDVPNIVRWLRSAPLPLASPFITFIFKALPRSLEAAFKRPWSYFPYIAMVYGSWELLKALEDLDDDDAEKLWKVVPEWLEHGLVVFLPGKDEHGRWEPVDLSYILPFGGWWQVAWYLKHGDAEEVLKNLGFFSHPMFSIPASILSNKDHFGRPVYTEGAPTQQKLQEVFGFIADQMLPLRTFTVGYGIAKAYEGRPTRFGEPGLTPAQARKRLFGINVYPYDSRNARDLKAYLMEKDIREAEMVETRIRRDRSLSREERRERLDRQREHVQSLKEQRREFLRSTAGLPR